MRVLLIKEKIKKNTINILLIWNKKSILNIR